MLNPFDIVIFGGGGDLALRKLLPAMYRAYQEGNLPEGSRILPTVRGQEHQKDYIDAFNSVIFKIVLNAADTSNAPKIKNFRLIAVA